MANEGVFIATYAFIAVAVGWLYFARQNWPEFFRRHAIRDSARDPLTLHLMIGAAAVGAAWPVAIVFVLYAGYMALARRLTGRDPERANV
jgi:hypothetical protein